jgi:hypothetical protein
MNPTTKRINWINAGMGMLFGTFIGRLQSNPAAMAGGGLYGYVQQLQAWTSEGLAAGFIPKDQNTPAAFPVVDTDFNGTFPSCTAASFMAAVQALEGLNAAYVASYAALVAIKP